MKKRIRWNPSPAPGVACHRLYWSVGKAVDYDSDFVELISHTDLILPDDVPSFPFISGIVELGITALDRVGNESDMTKRAIFVDFVPPKPHQASLRNIIQYPYDIRT
jgi:hypothetical protein